MSKRQYFLRYSLILKKLQKSQATFDEISDYLLHESELIDYDLSISKRTFQRDLTEIRDIFRIDIQYDFARKVYFIADENKSAITGRMLEAFDMFNALNMTDDLSHYIHFEKRKAQGTDHFYGLIHSIKNQLVIKFSYFKFEDEVITQREAEPHALKEFKGRWYLLANDKKDNSIKTFGLDRIQDLEITKKRFENKPNFNASDMFKNCFGIIEAKGSPVEDIILSFDPFQGKYIKTLPLHSTQVILVDNEDELQVKLKLCITHDLVMELLSFGDNMKVLQPQALIDELKTAHEKAFSQY